MKIIIKIFLKIIGYFNKYCKIFALPYAKRIILGAGNTNYPGWISTEKSLLNLIKRENFSYYWKPGTISIFLAEHVWEHLDEKDRVKAISNCFEFLKPGGRLRLAVPDGFHPNSDYIETVKPNGNGEGAEDHKILYNYRLLQKELEIAGFEVQFLEYWDESGTFHFQKWDSKDGHIARSKYYDERNQDGSLNYTSLIVDAIKPAY